MDGESNQAELLQVLENIVQEQIWLGAQLGSRD